MLWEVAFEERFERGKVGGLRKQHWGKFCRRYKKCWRTCTLRDSVSCNLTGKMTSVFFKQGDFKKQQHIVKCCDISFLGSLTCFSQQCLVNQHVKGDFILNIRLQYMHYFLSILLIAAQIDSVLIPLKSAVSWYQHRGHRIPDWLGLHHPQVKKKDVWRFWECQWKGAKRHEKCKLLWVNISHSLKISFSPMWCISNVHMPWILKRNKYMYDGMPRV